MEKIREILSKFKVKNVESPADLFRFCENTLTVEKNDDLIHSLIYPGSPILSLRDSRDATIFHVACGVLDINHNILHNLIKHGVDINAQNWEGRTPLHIAYFAEELEFCDMTCYTEKEIFRNTKFLIKNGANTDISNKNGYTPVHRALILGCLEAVEIFLNEEIPFDIENRCLYVIKSLLKQKPFYNLSPRSCSILSKFSIVNKDCESLKYVLSKTKIDLEAFYRSNGSNLLRLASSEGEPQCVKVLLDGGVDSNAPNRSDVDTLTPLHKAAHMQSIELVEILLKGGANVNALSVNHLSPLMTAICNFSRVNPKTVKILLDHGADIEAKDCFGQTALSHACKKGNLEIVKILLSRRASIERSNISTLHYAVLGRHPDIVEIILKQGLSVNCRCDSYGTPLELAISQNRSHPNEYTPVIEVLLSHIAKMIATKKYVSRENRELLKEESIERIYEIYAEELTNMKNKNVSSEMNFSFFDILTKDIDYLGGALKHEDLKLVLKEGKYQEKFDKYSKELRNRIQEAHYRRQLIELASGFLQKYANKRLPFEIVLIIFKNLSIKDLNNFLFVSFFQYRRVR